MANILIAYSTVDGHTRKISEWIRDRLVGFGHTVTLHEIRDDAEVDLSGHDCIVIGASIRYGKHRPNVMTLIDRQRDTLEQKPTAFFTVNVVARKPGKNTPDSNPYLKTFVGQSRWKPTLLGVFAGKIDYARYRLHDRVMIRFIMWMTNGPTDPTTCVEFTDWAAVDRFADQVDAIARPVDA